MSFCKPVREIESIKYNWIPGRLRTMYANYTIEEFVLCVRNGFVNMFLYDDEYSEADKGDLLFLTEDVRDTLVMNGFIRPEMITDNPELYFLKDYLIKYDIVTNYILEKDLEDDYDELFMPYYYSNEQYENYVFRYERIEAILGILSNFLDKAEYHEVALDIMYMSDQASDDVILERAKKKLADSTMELVPLLAKVFAMF